MRPPNSDRVVAPDVDVDLREEIARLRRELRDRDRRLQRTIGELEAAVAEAVRAWKPEPRGAEAERAEREEEYRRQKSRFRSLVDRVTPRSGRVAVVSRGDEDLLDLRGRRAHHFPRAEGGGFLGYYPPDGTAVIAQLETLRSLDVSHLAFPPSALWWFDAYPRFAAYLERRYEIVGDAPEAGRVVRIEERRNPDSTEPLQVIRRLIDRHVANGSTALSLLDFDSGLELSERFPEEAVFSPPSDGSALPYLDDSVDIVVVGGHSGARLKEARRVAARAVIRRDAHGLTVESDEARTPGIPGVAIIVPTFNGLPHLLPCLRRLEETLPPEFEGSVVVVDDASSDGTSEALAGWMRRSPWLRVIRNGRNHGFLSACNRGAKATDEPFLVFLNDDTLPLDGWLEPLLGTFAEHPEAGAVGGKLLYPDGRLQEAGGLVFSDGSGANFGRGDAEVDAPLYGYLRPVDYCSGALLATPRTLFEEIGGFDRRYRPAYYEDTDYCFAVRELGYAVYYQPETAVVHVEGGTSGTDETAGVKRYQAVNRRKFVRKWRRRLARRPEPPGRWDRSTWFALAGAEAGVS